MSETIPERPVGRAEAAAIRTAALDLWYGEFRALAAVSIAIERGLVTSLIGPSGCGKTTLLRTFNRQNERFGNVRTTGRVEVLGADIYAPEVDLVELRRKVGMVFQRPNPLPLSVRENVLFGHRTHVGRRPRTELDGIVKQALRDVGLWEPLAGRLDARAIDLPLEQQQRLCIARLLPVKPDVILMDEPCSALDAKATARVEELILTLRGRFTIVIVTHNMAQARRVSDTCAFMMMGELVEHGRTQELFLRPRDPRTADYIEGRFG